MEIINGTSLSKLCDYSFGDHLGGLEPQYLRGGFMKYANETNVEFLDKCKEFEGKVMSLFIDNIRLYPRSIWANEGPDADWVAHLLVTNDLLKMCGELKNNKFVIFTSHEDTPIDDQIVVPDNVLGIHAVNAEFNNEKIHPFPYGLQRKLAVKFKDDMRISIMKKRVEVDKHIEPTKLLYINCGIGRNEERQTLTYFEGLPWVTARFDRNSKFFPYNKYSEFLDELANHKFMVCPKGHGLDCHRNWESLYLRRVPVMLKHPYFTRLMKDFPVLFIDKWEDITEELLIENDHLYQEALKMDLSKLDLKKMFKGIMKKYESEAI